MANTIMLPKLGQTMEEGIIVEWLKREGDPVNRGDILFQVESDKAVLEVESRHKGVLLKILVGPNVKVPVLTPVGIIGEPGEDISALTATAGGEAAEASPGQPAPQAEAAGEPGAAIVEAPGRACVQLAPGTSAGPRRRGRPLAVDGLGARGAHRGARCGGLSGRSAGSHTVGPARGARPGAWPCRSPSQAPCACAPSRCWRPQRLGQASSKASPQSSPRL
jgi:pyruvate dehydrogenase E2 component (dihydrolipoamide acetyltransferase)